MSLDLNFFFSVLKVKLLAKEWLEVVLLDLLGARDFPDFQNFKYSILFDRPLFPFLETDFSVGLGVAFSMFLITRASFPHLEDAQLVELAESRRFSVEEDSLLGVKKIKNFGKSLGC